MSGDMLAVDMMLARIEALALREAWLKTKLATHEQEIAGLKLENTRLRETADTSQSLYASEWNEKARLREFASRVQLEANASPQLYAPFVALLRDLETAEVST